MGGSGDLATERKASVTVDFIRAGGCMCLYVHTGMGIKYRHNSERFQEITKVYCS